MTVDYLSERNERIINYLDMMIYHRNRDVEDMFSPHSFLFVQDILEGNYYYNFGWINDTFALYFRLNVIEEIYEIDIPKYFNDFQEELHFLDIWRIKIFSFIRSLFDFLRY